MRSRKSRSLGFRFIEGLALLASVLIAIPLLAFFSIYLLHTQVLPETDYHTILFGVLYSAVAALTVVLILIARKLER